jgi:long-chain acyl-CoA synthetase
MYSPSSEKEEMDVTSQEQPKTIPEMFYRRTKASAYREAVLYKQDGTWRPLTWKDLEQRVREVARGIVDWVKPKDIVCLLSENRPEWWIGDLATLSLAGVSAPIYPTNPPKDIAYILNDCGAKLLFVSNLEQLDKIRQLKADKKIPKLKRVILFDNEEVEEDWVLTMSEVRQRNEDATDPIEGRMAKLKPEDLATLIYTSGTTGEPKGVMLSHENLVSNTLGADVVIREADLDDRMMLSFLPLSHSFERTSGYYVAIHYDFKVAFAESLPQLVENMGEVRPTLLISVPRIYEKLYAKVMANVPPGQKKADPLQSVPKVVEGLLGVLMNNIQSNGLTLSGLIEMAPRLPEEFLEKLKDTAGGEFKKNLVLWALEVGKEHASYRLKGMEIPRPLEIKYAVANKLVFSKLHEKLGGRLKYAISGGAPLAPEIADFLNAIGLSVCEGYGLSETSPVVCANRPSAMKVGSVGKPFPDVEIKIEPDPEREGNDGEILTRGPNLMLGYYNKPEATEEVIDEDGWFHTGDIGYVDHEGFLFITDRKKELIKTAGGKYVAPQPIENQLKVSTIIEQAVVIGDTRKYCVALIVPSFEALESTLDQPLPANLEDLNNMPEVRALYQGVIDEVNQPLGRWEQIKRFALLPAEMTQETGELTPSMKVKRRVVDKKYKEIIDSLYPPA